MHSHEPNRMGIDKFGRSSGKKLKGPRGLRGIPSERGEQGPQGPPGDGFIKTLEGDYDIDGKLIRNVGRTLANQNVVTKEYLEDIFLEQRNNIRKHFDYEMSILERYVENMCLKMTEDLTKYIRNETQKLQKILPDQYFLADTTEIVQLPKYRQL